jgi:hypothetical protein
VCIGSKETWNILGICIDRLVIVVLPAELLGDNKLYIFVCVCVYVYSIVIMIMIMIIIIMILSTLTSLLNS